MLALVVSITSLFVAAVAMSDASRLTAAAPPAAPSAAATAQAVTPGATDPTAVNPAVEPPASVTASPGGISPQAEFTVAYQAQELQLQPGECRPAKVDLDEPRVGVADRADLQIVVCGGTKLSFELLGSAGSQVTAATVTPKDCAEKIRTAPLPQNAQVPITKGVVLCEATSLENSIKEGITQKIVVIEVRAIGADGTVNVLVSAWNVPR